MEDTLCDAGLSKEVVTQEVDKQKKRESPPPPRLSLTILSYLSASKRGTPPDTC